MITEAVMNAVLGVWLALLSALPEEDEDNPIAERFEWDEAHGIFDGVLMVNGWIPMYLILVGLATLLAFRLLVFLYSFAYTAWKALLFT